MRPPVIRERDGARLTHSARSRARRRAESSPGRDWRQRERPVRHPIGNWGAEQDVAKHLRDPRPRLGIKWRCVRRMPRGNLTNSLVCDDRRRPAVRDVRGVLDDSFRFPVNVRNQNSWSALRRPVEGLFVDFSLRGIDDLVVHPRQAVDTRDSVGDIGRSEWSPVGGGLDYSRFHGDSRREPAELGPYGHFLPVTDPCSDHENVSAFCRADGAPPRALRMSPRSSSSAWIASRSARRRARAPSARSRASGTRQRTAS
ncbi:MAG: hypothetical protein HMLKMBBP_01811 [Planctomycetes bacterium]|nr:hypothetical protein [Planctomycetota bacterium]